MKLYLRSPGSSVIRGIRFFRLSLLCITLLVALLGALPAQCKGTTGDYWFFGRVGRGSKGKLLGIAGLFFLFTNRVLGHPDL